MKIDFDLDSMITGISHRISQDAWSEICKSSSRFKTDSRQNDEQKKLMTWSQWNEETLAWLMFDSININKH